MKNSIDFHVCKKNYSASSGQHIFMILVSIESLMNKAIYNGYLVKFQRCMFYEQQFKVQGNFEKSHFPIDVNGDVAKKTVRKQITSFQKFVALKRMHGII